MSTYNKDIIIIIKDIAEDYFSSKSIYMQSYNKTQLVFTK